MGAIVMQIIKKICFCITTWLNKILTKIHDRIIRWSDTNGSSAPPSNNTPENNNFQVDCGDKVKKAVKKKINRFSKIYNPILKRIPKSKLDWVYTSISCASFLLIVFGGLIIIDTVIIVFIYIYEGTSVWYSNGFKDFINQFKEGLITVKLLQLSDNVLIALTTLLAGSMLFRLPDKLTKDPSRKVLSENFSDIIHGIDKAVLSMATIALSINFLVVTLIDTSNGGMQKDSFSHAGFSTACVIIAIAFYIFITHILNKKND